MTKQQINKTLSIEMDRKDFLKHVGIAFIAVVGIGAMLQTFSTFGRSIERTQTTGYGGSPYGK